MSAEHRGGCKPRMAGCAATCLHRQLVEGYRVARHADDLAAEYESHGYATELAEYRAQRPALTFRQWLEGHRAPRQQDVAA